MCWTKITRTPGKFNLYYDIYETFWGKSLNIEQQAVSADDGDGMVVEESFNVLTIHARLPRLTNGKLIVRQEYLVAVASLEERHALKPRTGGVVVGHPGIGKSWFLYYLLVLRLSQGKKTILNLEPNDVIYLFDGSGCYVFTGTTLHNLLSSPLSYNAWALLDSPNRKVPPNPILSAQAAPMFKVFSSSPNEDRYEDFKVQNRALIHVMGNWSFHEVLAGLTLQRQPNEGEQDLLREYFLKYGPSTRDLSMLYEGTTTTPEMDDAIETALMNTDVDKPQRLVNMARGGMSAIILAYPDPTRRTKMLADIISFHVFQLLADKLFVRGFENMVKTYRLFHDLNPLSVSAGWIFEYYCHRIISGDGGRKLSIIPLTVTSSSTRKKIPFKLCRPDRNKEGWSFPLTTRRRHHFGNEDKLNLSNEEYFVPNQTNKPAYDGFLVTADVNNFRYCLGFQMTTKSEHDAKTSGIDDLRGRVGGMPLIFILLMPKEREHDDIILAVPEEAWSKATYYIAVVDVVDVNA